MFQDQQKKKTQMLIVMDLCDHLQRQENLQFDTCYYICISTPTSKLEIKIEMTCNCSPNEIIFQSNPTVKIVRRIGSTQNKTTDLSKQFLEHVLKKWSSLFLGHAFSAEYHANWFLSSKIFSFGLPKAVPTPWPSKHPPLSLYT